jgi:hypothetical protein
MHSTQQPKPTDDPHDVIVVAPDAVRVAPSDDEISDLLRAAARQRSDSQGRKAADPSADSPVPPVDTTFRPAAVNEHFARSRRRSFGRQAVRAITALLLAACIGGAAMAWQASGNAAKKLFARWVPQFALTTSLPLDKLGFGSDQAPPAEETDGANVASPQPASLAQSAPEGAAANAAAPAQNPSPSLQSMARDLASVSQEVEQLKATIAELKASQQQMSRDPAKTLDNKVSERAKLPPPAPTRPAVAHARKPTPLSAPYSPTPTAAPAVVSQVAQPYPPQAAQPYVPRQAEPLPPPPAQPQPEPGFTSVPRPPMPVQQ